MAIPKRTDSIRDEIMEFARKSEETISEAGRKLGERARELVPGDGQSIRRVVDQAFDFTETILKSQREFANSLLDTLYDDNTSTPAPAARRAPTARRTTTKATKATKATRPVSAP